MTPKTDDCREAFEKKKRQPTRLCQHGIDASCVWCVGEYDPPLHEVLDAMEGEFK